MKQEPCSSARTYRVITVLLGLLIFLPALAADPEYGEGWSDTPWKVLCTDPDPCAPADEIYEQLLQHASQWFELVGFRAPLITPNEEYPQNFIAEVSDRHNRPRNRAGEIIELRGAYYLRAKKLYLRSDQYFTVGESGQSHDDPDFQHEAAFEFTPVHELFHGVQNSYQQLHAITSNEEKKERDWIWEGTAAAVQQAYADWFGSDSGARRHSRSFTTPLHKPGTENDVRGTWLFWRNIGRQTQSFMDIAYLRDILLANLQPNSGIDGVDSVLPGGLVTQLPEFFASLPDRYEYYFKPDSHTAPLPPGREEAEYQFPITIQELAGKGARIAVSSSTQEKVRVQISLEPNFTDLHLIVDSQLHNLGSGDQRNRFRDQLEGGEAKTYEVIVANVAPNAASSTKRDPSLRVELQIMEEVDCCSCKAIDLEVFSVSEGMPCDFKYPQGWQAAFDPYALSAVVASSCDKPCSVTPGLAFSVAGRPDSNAEVREQVWKQMMSVAGSASCGGVPVTFFSLPGADPNGPIGGLRFYVGHNGKKYGANATFTCPEPDERLELQQIFIGSFKTNADSTFKGE